MHGSHGRILHVDLSAPGFHIETPADEVLGAYLGGKGLASYLLFRDNPPGVDPLAPENRLIVAAGPAAGSAAWGSCRYGVFTKSPQTGFYSESYSGGRAPEALDAAGFDAVVIRGRSAAPTILVVEPEGASFHSAEGVWGLETYAAEDALRERFKPADTGWKSGALVIGPAGENGVRFALIENDYWRSAGRTGAGAVMGAKRLKGIFFRGDRRREVHDPDSLRAAAKALAAAAKDHPGVKAYKAFGTPMMVDVLNKAQAFPTRYWSAGQCAHREGINAAALHSRCAVTPHACLKCLMACGRLSTVRAGRHAGLRLEGPEYETIYAFGGLCLVEEIEEIAHLNDLCDRLGMDTISAGNLCALAIEAARRGRLALAIDYGDVDAIAELLRAIACREGAGAVLAEGIVHAARTWGLEDLAVHVKGLEPAGYDPRVLKGMGLAYATSDRGACHLRTTFYKPELSGMIPPEQIEDKAALLIDFEDRLTLFDTLILCRFYRDLYDWPALGQLVQALTGLPADKAALQGRAAAIADLVRRFNLREGLRPEDDCLPPQLHRPLADSGRVISPAELAHLKADYYRLRGWNARGVPPAA
jgi:aldehyde:ferredoxin oxidoreductase